MPDVFISHSTKDEDFAKFNARHLKKEGIKAFLASVSLRPGEKWRNAILNNLEDANWVIFLASKRACRSAWVQQELGVAIGQEKEIIPIVWDQESSNLPGWIDERQALDIRNESMAGLKRRITGIAKKIKTDKYTGYLIVGLIIAGFAYMSKKKKKTTD